MKIIVEIETDESGAVISTGATRDGVPVDTSDGERWRFQDLANQVAELEPVDREG